MERYLARWGALLLCLAGVACLPDGVLSPRARPPGFEAEKVRAASMFSSVGLSLGPLTIETYRRTPIEGGRRVTRMELVEGDDVWYVSCLLNAERQKSRRVCSIDDGDETAVLILAANEREPLSGRVQGAIHLTLEGQGEGRAVLSTYTPSLVIQRGARTTGTVISMGPWTRVNHSPEATRRERRFTRIIGLLQASLTDPRDAGIDGVAPAVTAEGDEVLPSGAYDLRLRRSRDGKPAAAHLARLEREAQVLAREGYGPTAAQLRRLARIEHHQVFDEEAGPRASRSALTGVAAQVGAGVVWAPSPDGLAPDMTPDGGRFHLAGGLRFNHRTTVMVGMGLQFPAFSFEPRGEAYAAPAGRYLSGSFNISLTGRHGFAPLFGGLEPVVGLSLRARMTHLSYDHPDLELADDESAASSMHLGIGAAPIAGLQWAFEDYVATSRVVLFWEWQPEFTIWAVRHATDHTEGAAAGAAEAVEVFEAAGSRPTMQWGTSFGVRLEL